MKKVLGVSLGSSSRNHIAKVNILGQEVEIERRGTDGDVKKMMQLYQEYDGKVDVFTLGGTDLYLYSGPKGKRYTIKESARIVSVIKKTPIVDGSGIKYVLEKDVIRYITKHTDIVLQDKKALLLITVDRFGLAEGLIEAGCKMTFGDLISCLNIPIPIYSLSTLNKIARVIIPVLVNIPIKYLYPTGKKQETSNSKFTHFFDQTDIVAGDYIAISQYMPNKMEGKIVITNTVTSENVQDLKDRGVKYLITTTPQFQGRSFGTNVYQGLLVAVSGKKPEELKDNDYLELLKKIDFKPRIEKLNN
ncbi:MAG: quinate 5-dehydrogenase [Candidatus Caldatribacteriota bacterium]|nr:quinate 5-dehydrogenase [Atribacterota bacterium]MDD3030774.1 quinate 5-dehydrogenase [Atribacterota bacterium]MDD3641201.1 quinate 5-dehydrogenase [Atribacterota bacterium]MDD4288225.1 quinate 5-dehydrogenase [Atribacterota bacterium]MDD4764444.1 quinate 5-dehydrogenase [Atribacterota bacterium]